MSTLMNEAYKMDAGIMHEHLLMLMDTTSFTEFRDYYLRKGMYQTDLRYFKKDQNNKFIKEHLNDPDLTQIENRSALDYAKQFAGVCNQNGNQKFTNDLKNLIESFKLDNITTPYEKVGKVLDFLKAHKPQGIKICYHDYLRGTMEHMLLNLTCIDLKNKPDIPVFENGLDSSLINLLQKAKKHKNYTWKSLWSQDRIYHARRSWTNSNSLDTDNRYIEKANVINTLRKEFTSGEHLLTSRLFRHGYMYNRLSWARIQEFIERQYILTATTDTFDKQFFKEWLSGYNWSSKENEQRFESWKNECLLKWNAMISELVVAEIEFLLPIVITNYDNDSSDPGTARSIDVLLTMDIQCSTTEIKNRLPEYMDNNLKLRIDSIKNHPVIYLYKDIVAYIANIDAKKILTDAYPNIQKLDILLSDALIKIGSFEYRDEHLLLVNYLLSEIEDYNDVKDMEFIV